MNQQDILLLYQYNDWSNNRILNAAAKTAPDQFLAPASYPHGSLRNTLTHILFAEWIWRTRWLGESPQYRFKPEDFPTFTSLRERWAKEEKALRQFVNQLNEEKLSAVFEFKTTHGDFQKNILWQAMAHVVNHGTQHRSEAAAMLTDFGCSPGDIDLIVFLRELN